RWMVFDDRGGRIDHSRNLVDADLTSAWIPPHGAAELPGRLVDRLARPWQIAQRRIRPTAHAASGSRAAERAAPAEPEPTGGFHSGLVPTVGAPRGPIEAAPT